MPHSKGRVCTLSYNEDSGELSLTLPHYEEDELVSMSTLLFMAVAQRMQEDGEWLEDMVGGMKEVPLH